jgi:hypothetical protein
MEEIKVGEYIRSKDGYIGKVEKLKHDMEYNQNYLICEKDNVMASNYTENIVKHSPNIIDLIEEGDYVNGCYCFGKEQDKLVIENGAMIYGEQRIKQKDIEDIVTHEQFNQMKYIVGDESNE